MRRVTLFLLVLAMTLLGRLPLRAAVPEVKWDKYSLIIDGQRVMPVMGEIHYSRVPAEEWGCEVRKMKEGGVTMIATYVFWNHIEEQEGIFRWDGQRSLRAFLEVCRQEQMPVILRLGPFCHGEVRNGGIPDWMFAKGCRLREENATFLGYVETLYRQIFTQVQGLQWKDGGPVIAAQFDNEYRGRGEYLMALKKIALQVGFDLPFYTRTGWPALRTPVPYGEMIPLYGDYADGFWDKEVKEGVGNYYKAFNFKAFRSSTAIGTDLLGKQEAKLNTGDEQYPYFTCELGGGMATAYHRRPYVYPEDAYSMALFPKFVYTNDEELVVPIEIYNASEGELRDCTISWHIGNIQGVLPVTTIPLGKNHEVGTVQLPLTQYDKPIKLTLRVDVKGKYHNQWDFWVYPKENDSVDLDTAGQIYETDTLDAKALSILQQGGKVLLTAGGHVHFGNDVRHTFLPVFWNTSWFKMRPPHTTGAYIQKDHPVFRDFPTDEWQNLNWWELTNRTQVMNLSEFPSHYQPIVQPIDTWHVSRKLGMLIEARVLNGRLLMTTMDIKHHLDSRLVARQLRYSILRYMQSPDFLPTMTLGVDVIRHLYERKAPAVNMFTRESPDELKPKLNN